MVSGLKDKNNLIRQLYLLIYKYNGDLNSMVIDAIKSSKLNINGGIRFNSVLSFDSYMGTPRELNDELITLFITRYYNGDFGKLLNET